MPRCSGYGVNDIRVLSEARPVAGPAELSRFAGRLFHGAVNGEGIGQARGGKNPHHCLLWCGEYEVTADLAGLPPAAR